MHIKVQEGISDSPLLNINTTNTNARAQYYHIITLNILVMVIVVLRVEPPSNSAEIVSKWFPIVSPLRSIVTGRLPMTYKKNDSA